MVTNYNYDSKELQEFNDKLGIFSSKYDIGRTIYNRRIEFKITQEELAFQTHVHRSAIEYIERVGNDYLVSKKKFSEKLNRVKLLFDALDIKINEPSDYSHLSKSLKGCSIPLTKKDESYNEIKEFVDKLNILSMSYDIGSLIHEYRINFDISQYDLGHMLGLGPNRIGAIERLGNTLLLNKKGMGKLTNDIKAIFDKLNIDIDRLLLLNNSKVKVSNPPINTHDKNALTVSLISLILSLNSEQKTKVYKFIMDLT